MKLEVLENGVHYDWFISGPDGAHFILYEKDPELIKQAKVILRRDHDVLSIRQATKEEWAEINKQLNYLNPLDNGSI